MRWDLVPTYFYKINVIVLQIRHILQLVADNTGFLVEDRLFELIKKYQTSSRNLCTLDAIFMVRVSKDINLI